MPISSAGSTEAGVTLVEMVVVVAVVGVIVAVVAPSMASGLDSVRMASATDNVASFLNSAVNRAERRQQPVMVEIVPKENRMTMYSLEAAFKRDMPMPEGIRIESEATRLILMPGASVPGIAVQLINQHGNRRVVRLDPMTGYPRIETPKEGQ